MCPMPRRCICWTSCRRPLMPARSATWRKARWCQILGAKRIIGIDCVAARLEIGSKQLGIETINLKEHDTTKKLLEMVRLFPVRPRRDDRFSRSPMASIVRSKRPVSIRPSLCCTTWKALSTWKRTLETSSRRRSPVRARWERSP